MDRMDAKLFRERWQAVEKIQIQEAASATIGLRWRQLNAAYELAKELCVTFDHADEAGVYQRWARLKESVQPTSPN